MWVLYRHDFHGPGPQPRGLGRTRALLASVILEPGEQVPAFPAVYNQTPITTKIIWYPVIQPLPPPALLSAGAGQVKAEESGAFPHS